MKSFFDTLDGLKPVYDTTYKIVMLLCKILLTAEIVICSWVVFCRFIGPYLGLRSPAWGEEIILTCMVYMALISAAMAVRRNAHIRMTAFDRYLPEKVVTILDLISDILVFCFALVMLVIGWKTASGVGSRSFYISIPTLSKFWLFFSVPLAGAAMIIFELESFYNHLKKLLLKEAV